MFSNIFKRAYIFPGLIALLVYLPSVVYIPIETYLLFAFIPFFFKSIRNTLKEFWKKKATYIKDRSVLLILFILFLSFINIIIFNIKNEVNLLNIYGPYILFPLLIFAAFLFANKISIKFYIVFVFLETLVGIAEWFYGASSFFTGIENYWEFTSYRLLYFTRVLGLSPGSSLFAIKIMLGIILIDYLKLKSKLFTIIKLFLFVGIVLTFGRTILVCLFIYLPLQFLFNIYFKKHKSDRSLFWNQTIFFLAFFAFCFINPKEFQIQFSRGGMKEVGGRVEINDNSLKNKGTVKTKEVDNFILEEMGTNNIELSGRSEIWSVFLSFIMKNPIFGNGSKTLYLGKKYHAHNSIIQIIANNGVIIAFLYFLLICFNLNKQNWFFIGAILLLALGQYVIFWGMSVIDIIFYALLMFSKK